MEAAPQLVNRALFGQELPPPKPTHRDADRWGEMPLVDAAAGKLRYGTTALVVSLG